MENYLATSALSVQLNNQIQQAFQKYGISPTPINYLVWYEYFLGNNTDFVNEIKQSLANNGQWHDILGLRLYYSFIKQQCADIHEFEDELTAAYQNLTATLGGLTANLDSHAELLEKGATPEALAALKQRHEALTNTNQRTQDLLTSLNKKAEKTITRNLKDPISRAYNRTKLDADVDTWRHLGALPPMVMIDIDQFSAIEREHGPLVSENLLRFTGKILSRIAGNRHVYRTGSNEFILCTGDTWTHMATLAEQARAAIARSNLKRKDTGSHVGGFTVTALIFQPGQQDLSTALELARRTLRTYKAREQRNAVHEL